MKNQNLINLGSRVQYKLIISKRDKTFPNRFHGVWRPVYRDFLPQSIRTKDDFVNFIREYGEGEYTVSLAKPRGFSKSIFKCTIHHGGVVEITKDMLDQIGLA